MSDSALLPPDPTPDMSNDIIGKFMDYTRTVISPTIFRLWSAIAMVAGGMERRVWMRTSSGLVVPNVYVMLVASPGIGKAVILHVKDLWSGVPKEPGGSAPAFHVNPDNMTKASLVDEMAAAEGTFLPPTGPMLHYHSLLVAAEEFGVLLPAYDQEYLNVLNSIYNNILRYEEKRRTGNVKIVSIDRPQLTLLAGTQPAWLASNFPPEAWGSGFSSRTMMVYSDEVKRQSLWAPSSLTDEGRKGIIRRLEAVAKMYGQMGMSPAAAKHLDDWQLAGGPPAPTHSRLKPYIARRTLHLMKLAMVSAASREAAPATVPTILDFDVCRALEWMLAAEATMPDIFRAMVGQSDREVLEEVFLYVSKFWQKTKRALPATSAVRFLSERCPGSKVGQLLELAVGGDIIRQVTIGTSEDGTAQIGFLPSPTHNFEVE